MKWFILTGFLVLLGHGESSVLRCSENGQDSPCSSEEEKAPRPAELPTGKQCAAGSTWRSRCRECVCSEEGLAVCNQTACEKEENELEKMYCAPNTRWKYDCNTCWCSERGHGACTLKGCVHFELPVPDLTTGKTSQEEAFTEPTQDRIKEIEEAQINKLKDQIVHNVLKRSPVCKPNQDFQNECNSCKCSADGQSYSCTQAECLERDMTKEVEVFMESEGVDHIERHSVCKPQDTFYIGCNTCHCNYDGTDFSCTNKPCPLPDDVELFHELNEMKPIVPVMSESISGSAEVPEMSQSISGSAEVLEMSQSISGSEDVKPPRR